MYDFFVSHSSLDKESIVDELVSMLKNMGYNVWYDKNEIPIGDDISFKINEGLKESYCLILIISDNLAKSKWAFYEVGHFDAQKSRRIIPLIYNVSNDNRDCILKIIGNRKYIDMTKNTAEEIATELAKSLSLMKNEKNDLNAFRKLCSLQKQLASYETVNSDIISIKLKEYLELYENQKDYLILSAKKIVRIISETLLHYHGFNEISTNEENDTLIKLIYQNEIGNRDFCESVDFIFNQDSEKSACDLIPVLNNALVKVIKSYIQTKYPFSLSLSQIETVFPDDLSYKDFEDMYEIDKKVMREDLIADVKTTFGWFKYNKYTHLGVREISSGRIVGYFSVLPITEETYNKILSGNFLDKDFDEDSIEQYIFSNYYKIYIAGVGIDPDYQNTGAFIKLYNALIDLFIYLAKDREIYISEVLAEASTKQGEKFCKMVGMKKIVSTDNGTDVYKLVTIPPEFQLKNHKGKELYDLCYKRFEEFRDFLSTTW